MKKGLINTVGLAAAILVSNLAQADNFEIDTRGMHASILFKVKHLGYSWLEGRFDKFDGNFEYDAAHPEKSKVKVHIDVSSINTNHAERDKHLRSARFFDTSSFGDAYFESTSIQPGNKGNALVKGNFTLRGVTKPVVIDAEMIGSGKDPWGGYRAGFTGTTTLHLSDYNMKESKMLGAVAENVEVTLNIEGVRK